jgi:hypothetical protein
MYCKRKGSMVHGSCRPSRMLQLRKWGHATIGRFLFNVQSLLNYIYFYSGVVGSRPGGCHRHCSQPQETLFLTFGFLPCSHSEISGCGGSQLWPAANLKQRLTRGRGKAFHNGQGLGATHQREGRELNERTCFMSSWAFNFWSEYGTRALFVDCIFVSNL